MKAAKQLEGCASFSHSLSPYLDGELDPAHAVDVEAHASVCEGCADRVAMLRALRASLKRVVSAPRASDVLRARAAAALAAAKAEATLRESREPSGAASGAASGAEGPGGPRGGDAGETAPGLESGECESRPSKASLAALAGDAGGATGAGKREGKREPRLIALRYALGLAAAAAVVVGLGAARSRQDPGAQAEAKRGIGAATEAGAAVARAQASRASATASLDSLLEDLVELHARPVPPETRDPAHLRSFEPFVGVPVRKPEFRLFGARFEGARLERLRASQRTALLHYVVRGGHRVTVYVFDPDVMSMRAASRLKPRVLRERAVYVGTLKGYSVAATEGRGIGYALASDLDGDRAAQLVMAAVP